MAKKKRTPSPGPVPPVYRPPTTSSTPTPPAAAKPGPYLIPAPAPRTTPAPTPTQGRAGGGTFPAPSTSSSRGDGGGGSFGTPNGNPNGTRSLPNSTGASDRLPSSNANVSTNTVPYTEGDGSLYDVLGLPPEWANEVYTEQYGFEDKGQVDGYGYSVNTATGSNSSIAAGIQWLRDLSVQDKEGYNSLVYSLYAAGYLSAADTRYGSFTSGVAEAFANAAHDTYVINQSQSGGSTTTLFNHLDDLAAGYEESGTGPSGSSSNATEPVRVDQWTDRDTLTANLRAAAQNALGRSLTDDETAAFVSAFHGQEQTWNDEQWAAQNGTGTSITDRPSASATAQDYVGNQFEQEKAGQDLGSYMGVLRNLMGLGTGGVGSAAG